MYIPENLISRRILGKDRMEPCPCGHFHFGKEVIIPTEKDVLPSVKHLLDGSFKYIDGITAFGYID